MSGADIHFAADEHVVAGLSLALARDGIAITALVPETATLEELFLHLPEGNGAEPVVEAAA